MIHRIAFNIERRANGNHNRRGGVRCRRFRPGWRPIQPHGRGQGAGRARGPAAGRSCSWHPASSRFDGVRGRGALAPCGLCAGRRGFQNRSRPPGRHLRCSRLDVRALGGLSARRSTFAARLAGCVSARSCADHRQGRHFVLGEWICPDVSSDSRPGYFTSAKSRTRSRAQRLLFRTAGLRRQLESTHVYPCSRDACTSWASSPPGQPARSPLVSECERSGGSAARKVTGSGSHRVI
jgi:hypothetical protein